MQNVVCPVAAALLFAAASGFGWWWIPPPPSAETENGIQSPNLIGDDPQSETDDYVAVTLGVGSSRNDRQYHRSENSSHNNRNRCCPRVHHGHLNLALFGLVLVNDVLKFIVLPAWATVDVDFNYYQAVQKILTPDGGAVVASAPANSTFVNGMYVQTPGSVDASLICGGHINPNQTQPSGNWWLVDNTDLFGASASDHLRGGASSEAHLGAAISLCQTLNFQVGIGTMWNMMEGDLFFFYAVTFPVVVLFLALPFRL